MRIGELAKLAGVTPRTIRYYESLGLLGPSEREGKGFRYYTETELERLEKIHAFKELGLTLEEIADVMPVYYADPTRVQGKRKIVEILKGHLQDTDEKIQALIQFRSDLQSNIDRIQQWIDAQAES
ncbi:MerR family transcriptional regulator [Oscillatoria sp. FACHB-1407]|uniref:MerR family transcriptional regulator n=1 Tax=Oscillatoria sp. FACHB-1407 TaxID=2692847 RepID=UPI0016859204|nr:MerR family transcriptional regulator [Oscillatoria sp. FACHB-1407]MBD2464522.1 MerR family transcriptional regulator [Oscillatoria sp. FACHB-1407]